jgi:hypothetical protein
VAIAHGSPTLAYDAISPFGVVMAADRASGELQQPLRAKYKLSSNSTADNKVNPLEGGFYF